MLYEDIVPASLGMSASGLVSRVLPVHTAVRNCTRDEAPCRGRQSGVDLKPPQAALVKSDGGEHCGNAGTKIPAGKVERGERKQTVDEGPKADKTISKPGGEPTPDTGTIMWRQRPIS